MGWIRNQLRKSDALKEIYRRIVMMSPKRRYFEKNLKKVVEFDRTNGTDFSGRLYQDEIGTTKERANDYSPSPDKLEKCLRKMSITFDDAIVDMGCGKGYAMYIMSRFPFGRVGGWNSQLSYVI